MHKHSPNSFSMMAIFLPCWPCRMWLTSVVFPLPRNPVTTVTGILLAGPASIAFKQVGDVPKFYDKLTDNL